MPRSLRSTADVDGDVLGLRADADDHAAVYFGTGRDEHGAALLRVPNAIGDGLAGFKGDEGAGITAGDLSLVGLIALENGVDDAVAMCLEVSETRIVFSQHIDMCAETLHFSNVGIKCLIFNVPSVRIAF